MLRHEDNLEHTEIYRENKGKRAVCSYDTVKTKKKYVPMTYNKMDKTTKLNRFFNFQVTLLEDIYESICVNIDLNAV
jgi:hypothetical protein